jgi:hypothetical protein
MSWTSPVPFEDGQPLTAATLNTLARDNLLMTGPGVATTASRLITASGYNKIAEHQEVHAYTAVTFSTSSDWAVSEDEEGNLYGPSVTVEHNGLLRCVFDARIRRTAGAGAVMVGVGSKDAAPENTNATLRTTRTVATRGGMCTLLRLDPGISMITLFYGTTDSATVGEISQRRLTVVPY